MTTTMTSLRTESDSLGNIGVPNHKYWGAQTQRALKHFNLGNEVMPIEIIRALAMIKKAAAIVHQNLGLLSPEKARLIIAAAEELINGTLLDEHFPLHIWQSGSGTQTNMNVNEVIANRAIEMAGGTLGSKNPIHPNDDVNLSQSTNDVFPSAMHIAAAIELKNALFPTLATLKSALQQKQEEFKDLIKIGRTHLQDAVPLTLGQEFSGYAAQIESNIVNLNHAFMQLMELAIGGTAVGTGMNAPTQFGEKMAIEISKLTGIDFVSAPNKFAALAGAEAMVTISSALKNLACSLFKIADDIRWLASGPRSGLGELTLLSNEPGSSIMPGKVNPTQCEALTMICAQVIGNDATITFAASQGKFELNVYKPVIIHNLLNSIKLLSDGCSNFVEHALKGLKANREKIKTHLENSLMLVTLLVPKIGYDKAAKIAQQALQDNSSLREACIKLGFLSDKEFDMIKSISLPTT